MDNQQRRKRHSHNVTRSVFLGLWIVVTAPMLASIPPVVAQDSPTNGSPGLPVEETEDPLPTAEEIRQRLEAVAADASLEEQQRVQVTEAYNAALNHLENAAQSQQQLASLREAAESAPGRLEQLQATAQSNLEPLPPPPGPDATVDQLETAKRAAETDQAALAGELEAVQEQQRNRREQSVRLPQRIADLQATIAALEASRTDASVDESSPLGQAAAVARRAALAEARAELEVAQQRLRTFEAESAILPLEEELLQRRVAAATRRLNSLASRVASKRYNVVQAEAEQFQEVLEAAPPHQRQSAARTTSLLEQWPELISQTRRWETRLVELRDTYAALRSDLERARSLVETDLETGGGLSRPVGYLLQRKRNNLPGAADLERARHQQQEVVELAQEVLTRTDARLEELPAPSVGDDGQLNEPPLVTAERRILQAISRDAERLMIETLIPLGVQYESYAATTRDYRDLINRNLLWVRSDAPIRPSDVATVVDAVRWILQPAHLQDLKSALTEVLRSQPTVVAAYLLVLVLLFAVRPWLRRQLKEIGQRLRQRAVLQMRPTLQAMAITAVLAIPVALAVYFPSWLLSRSTPDDSFTSATAAALGAIGAMILPLELLRNLVRPFGVAAAHYGWPEAATGALRSAVTWTMLGILPLMLLWQILYSHSDVRPDLSVSARLLFAAMMAVAAVILWRLAHPRRGAASVLVAASPNGWIENLRWAWHPLVAAVPLGLAILALLGYGYSSTQLADRLYQTFWMMIVIAVLAGWALRWLVLSRRRIALQQRRAAGPPQRAPEGAPIETLDENQADVSTINQQTRRLIDAGVFVGILLGLYWIWSPVLPAIGFLERVELWEQRADDGTVLDTITLSNLLMAVPMLVLTFIIVRNLPGLMETALLQRLPLENAVRYAITTLTSYLLAGVGIALAAGTLGLHWSSIQWLIAGLGVGLGFGLQEIFANFISGIILLFEQPVRVGDIVTLDNTTGVVSRIRMRATTVTNWDRQEYIVPNKDLITGRLVNWTLSDETNRVVIEVGVPRGSDTRLACRILEEICRADPEVLDTPSPSVTFEGFGESSLRLFLRFYLASLEHRMTVMHNMYTSIHERFNEAGVEIAVPQRELTVRGAPSNALKAMADGFRAP